MRSGPLLAVVVLLTLPCLPGRGDAAPPRPAITDLDAFGRLPVRFNGRMTNWDAVARNYLRRICGRDTYTDPDNREQPALRWLLDAVVHGDRALRQRLIPVDDPGLIEHLGLPKTPAPDDQPPRYTPDELRATYPKLEAEAMRAATTLPPQRTARQRAALTLYWRVWGLHRASDAFRIQALRNRDQIAEAAQAVFQTEAAGAPDVVPPTETGQPWRSFPRATLDRAIAELENGPAAGTTPLSALADILLAYGAENAAGFKRAVDAYAGLLGKLDLTPGALNFPAPETWTESGVYAAAPPSWYGDVRANGHPVAEFEVVEQGARATVRINHFAGAVGTAADAVNAWRIGQQLAPLPRKKASQAVGSIKLDGRDVPLVEIVTPPNATGPTERLLAVLIGGDGRSSPHTFEVSFYGDADLVQRHRDTYIAFLRSWQVGTAKALDAWFPSARQPFQPIPTRMLGAIVPTRDGHLRAFKLLGDPEPVTQQVDAFDRFVRSLRFGKEAHDAVRWELPAAWRDATAPNGPVSFHIDPGPPIIQADLATLFGAEDGSVLQLVNAWRAMFDLPPVDDAGLAKSSRQVEVDGHTLTLIDLAHAAPATRPADR